MLVSRNYGLDDVVGGQGILNKVGAELFQVGYIEFRGQGQQLHGNWRNVGISLSRMNKFHFREQILDVIFCLIGKQ